MYDNYEIENISSDAPPPEENNIPKFSSKVNKEFLICPECSSALEIVSIDIDNNI